MKTAILFPGQGEPFVGMGMEENKRLPKYQNRWNNFINKHFPGLERITFNGSSDELTKTIHAQPAVFAASYGMWVNVRDILEEDDLVFAGHSLGEITALAATKVWDYDSAANIVKWRAQAMQADCEDYPGTMAAILAKPVVFRDILEVCQFASVQTNESVVPANYNSQTQLVISGSVNAIDEAIARIKEKKLGVGKKIKVSGAFHNPDLMARAAKAFEKALSSGNVKFADPTHPVYSNMISRPFAGKDMIQYMLPRHIVSMVWWSNTILNMLCDGVERMIVVGPGKNLFGFVKQNVPDDFPIYLIDSYEALINFAKETGQESLITTSE